MNSIVTLKGFFLLQSCLGITTAAAQQIASADFETTRENLAAVRQGLIDNDTKAALDALNSSDNSLFAVILVKRDLKIMGPMTTTNTKDN